MKEVYEKYKSCFVYLSGVADERTAASTAPMSVPATCRLTAFTATCRPILLPRPTPPRWATCRGSSFFQDEHLRELISYGLSNNTDMLTALLRVDQAEAQLKAAKLAFLPSLTLSPQGSLSSVDGGKPAKTYELPHRGQLGSRPVRQSP